MVLPPDAMIGVTDPDVDAGPPPTRFEPCDVIGLGTPTAIDGAGSLVAVGSDVGAVLVVRVPDAWVLAEHLLPDAPVLAVAITEDGRTVRAVTPRASFDIDVRSGARTERARHEPPLLAASFLLAGLDPATVRPLARGVLVQPPFGDPIAFDEADATRGVRVAAWHGGLVAIGTPGRVLVHGADRVVREVVGIDDGVPAEIAFTSGGALATTLRRDPSERALIVEPDGTTVRAIAGGGPEHGIAASSSEPRVLLGSGDVVDVQGATPRVERTFTPSTLPAFAGGALAGASDRTIVVEGEDGAPVRADVDVDVEHGLHFVTPDRLVVAMATTTRVYRPDRITPARELATGPVQGRGSAIAYVTGTTLTIEPVEGEGAIVHEVGDAWVVGLGARHAYVWSPGARELRVVGIRGGEIARTHALAAVDRVIESADGGRYAVIHAGRAQVFEVATGRLIGTLAVGGHSAGPPLDFALDGRLAVIGGEGLEVLDPETFVARFARSSPAMATRFDAWGRVVSIRAEHETMLAIDDGTLREVWSTPVPAAGFDHLAVAPGRIAIARRGVVVIHCASE
ncbi:hypothetical protein DB32_006733 [Sandaracinus amylolyticus]|uniref:Uncharacterized protein n=1 Tax=Sandaracinus amylolyticus TaxID=927083 RepID=A0A0F6SH01_9BACT|nr:hypothetical protein DB32_006733 [Sandaracinus amylolyticus]